MSRGSFSKVENTCKLKLHIPTEEINDVCRELGNNYEISGIIHCNDADKFNNISKNKGDADSVFTPNDIINFHTHPVSAYNAGETVWGWPSGEDVRETIKFALAGNKAHLVFTVEGLYTIQVSPCKLKKIKELLNDTEIGILIFMIEEYFKTTHNFRGVDEVNSLAKKGIMITPYSFIDFINNFKLSSLLSKESKSFEKLTTDDFSTVGHTGIHSDENNNKSKYSGLNQQKFSKIPREGFPEVDDDHIITNPAKKYIDKDALSELRRIGKFGEESDVKKVKQSVSDLVSQFEKIVKKFDEKPCEISWNSKNPDAWFFVNFFPSNWYINGKYKNEKNYKSKSITPNKADLNYIVLNHEPFIRIFSNQKEGCSMKSIAEKNNFKRGNTLFTKKFNFGKPVVVNLTNEELNRLSMEFGKKNLDKKLAKILKKMGKTPEQIQNFMEYIKN
jgi:hypothetical protein